MQNENIAPWHKPIAVWTLPFRAAWSVAKPILVIVACVAALYAGTLAVSATWHQVVIPAWSSGAQR